MLAYFRIFLLLFFPLVILFLILQFSVHPFLQGHSSQKLVSNSTDLPSKVVLIVIDALRYNYRNRFAVIDKTIKQFPQSTFFAKSRVGSPTMTTQRVQSLMTGSQVFSIVNILRTFEAKKVETDNIIWQLTNHGKISAAFGDNTWTTLFDFSHSVVCNNSFDIHDIDTCDQQVYRYLPQQILHDQRNKTKADFIVAHLLGIDHVGHSTSSITHSKMDTKINQISAFIQQIFHNSQNGTYFIVTGDHAMRGDGNHGGSSDEQTQTFLFTYFKGSQISQQTHYIQLSQIQLTSTLSILLDIPLPLNTIGNPILELLPRDFAKEETIREINKHLCKHYMKMLQFYTDQSFEDYFQKLQNAASLSYQKEILEQLTQKLSFLKFSAPKTVDVVTISVSVSALVLFFLLYAFSQEMLRLVFNTSLKAVCQIVFSGIGLFTLLSSFLSWDLTKNLSNSLLFGLILTVMTGFVLQRRGEFNWIKTFVILCCIFLMAQTEADKSNEYKTSIIRINFLHQFFSHKYIQLLASTGLFFITWKAIRNTNPTQKGGLSIRLLYYFKLSILVISFVNYIIVHIAKQPIYFLSTLLALTIILCLTTIPFLRAQSSLTKIKTITMLCISFLGLFMNEYYPLVVLTSWVFNTITYEYSNWPIMIGLWAKCVWWWAMGNRYQYSGINILRTYVFSQSYSTLLNGISLIFYLNSPFLLNLVFLNSKICQQHYFLFQGQVVTNKQRVLDEQKQSILEERTQNNYYERNKQLFNSIFLKSNYKQVSVLVIGLVAALWATIQNNQKLIFTIMCAPLLILITFITFSSLLFIWILAECFAKMVNLSSRRPSNRTS